MTINEAPLASFSVGKKSTPVGKLWVSTKRKKKVDSDILENSVGKVRESDIYIPPLEIFQRRACVLLIFLECYDMIQISYIFGCYQKGLFSMCELTSSIDMFDKRFYVYIYWVTGSFICIYPTRYYKLRTLVCSYIYIFIANFYRKSIYLIIIDYYIDNHVYHKKGQGPKYWTYGF